MWIILQATEKIFSRYMKKEEYIGAGPKYI